MRNAVLRFIPDATPVLTLNFRNTPANSTQGPLAECASLS